MKTMNPSEIKENKYYWYCPPYGKPRDIYKCLEIRFNESQNQWTARFEEMTDTCHSNSIGSIKKMNEIEMERYIQEIKDVKLAFDCYEPHQKAIVVFEELKYLDKNEKQVAKGDIIDLHQTVNGENIFVVLSISPLDIRYGHDLSRGYEYDKNDLLKPFDFRGETDYEIVGNIYEFLKKK